MNTKRMTTVLLLVSLAAATPAQVFITEFMAGGSALEDEDGNTPDWIEIGNVASTNVNLANWHLTDHAGSPAKWSFPSTNIASGGFLVVFASGKLHRLLPAQLVGWQLGLARQKLLDCSKTDQRQHRFQMLSLGH